MRQLLNPTLSWIHIGDLHIQNAGEPNHRLLQAMVDEINSGFRGQVDFCFLPGDNANEGEPGQYQIIRQTLSRLRLPVHLIPGDHDFTQDLGAFYSVLGAAPLPKAISLKGYRCLFIDIVSSGRGGPDFQLDASQLTWIENELLAARRDCERPLLFMHAYPADLTQGGEELVKLISRHRVLTVDMGHTHYNELANDGHTIYATTRSTGQIEEGPAGFSVMSVTGGHVSWRFVPVPVAWPLIMITKPAAAVLATDSSTPAITPNPLSVAARAWSPDGICQCRCRLDDGPWHDMSASDDGSRWSTDINVVAAERHLTVEATDQNGRCDRETIEFRPRATTRIRAADGSAADTVGAWPEKHILGTQLGPNKNGHAW